MNVFAVESVLEQLDDVVPYRVLGIEPLCPRQKLARIDSGLLDREAGVSLNRRELFARGTYLKVNPRCMGSLVFLMSDPMSVKKASTESAM